MAKRPVFIADVNPPFFKEEEVEFFFYSGFAPVQKQKSMKSLHEAYLVKHPEQRVLEVSSKSDHLEGIKLSAFHLKTQLKDGSFVPLECAFQSSKVFEDGKQYLDILQKSAHDAKKDERLRISGELKSFCFEGEEFPLVPKTFFYDWLYMQSLSNDPELCDMATEYDAFTDIEFNPQKSINCQARALAIYVGLRKAGEERYYLKSKERFAELYGEQKKEPEEEQMKMF